MKLASPKLDQYGFPIPADFDDDGPETSRRPSGQTGRRIRFVLRMAILAGLAVALWNHFELGRKLSARIAKYHFRQAWTMYVQQRNLPESLAAINRAVSWKPEEKHYLSFRAHVKFELRDYEGALEDVEKIVALDPRADEARALRQALFHNLGRHQEAAAAAGEMLAAGMGDEANVRNSRAYARALGDFELAEALTDIDRALELEPESAAFIDTRGYVKFRQGEYQAALDEFERAIKITKQRRAEQQQAELDLILRGDRARGDQRTMTDFDADLAVMYHHRGEAHEKLGNREQAARDLRTAEQLGYDPATGVY